MVKFQGKRWLVAITTNHVIYLIDRRGYFVKIGWYRWKEEIECLPPSLVPYWTKAIRKTIKKIKKRLIKRRKRTDLRRTPVGREVVKRTPVKKIKRKPYRKRRKK